MIQAVGAQRIRPVEHVVLVPQLIGDVLERLRQVLRLEGEERHAAGLFRVALQHLVAAGFEMRVMLVEMV